MIDIGTAAATPASVRRANTENTIALELECHINKLLEMQELPIQSYLYHEIARDTGHDIELVRRLCYSIDCGGNGFTVIKQGMTLAQVMAGLHASASK